MAQRKECQRLKFQEQNNLILIKYLVLEIFPPSKERRKLIKIINELIKEKKS